MRMLGGLIAIACAAGPAAADMRDDARREFGLGQAADGRRDWARALEHYLRANDLVPHPNTTYNIAVDYERLGRLREAAVWFQRYQEAITDPRERERTAQRIRELAARPGTVTVRSVPDGRYVAIDNRLVGRTPYSGPLAAGPHVISVDRGDNTADVREITVEFGEPVVVDTAPAALGTIPEAAPTRHTLGYLFGFGGGADLRGNGSVFGYEFGLRYRFVEAALRFGGVADELNAVDFFARMALSENKLAPFVGLGYSTAFDSAPEGSSAKGLLVVAGGRYIVASASIFDVTVVAETGLRFYDGLAMRGSVFVPVTATLQLGYRYSLGRR